MVNRRQKVSTPDPLAEPLRESSIHKLLNRPLDPADVAHATREIAQPLSTTRQDRRGYLAFELRSEQFLIASSEIDRVTHLYPVRRIPHRSNQVVRGLCHIEGDLLLCAELGELLQLPLDSDDPPTDARMIAFGGRNRWVIAVDRIHGVTYLDDRRELLPPLTVRESLHRFVDKLTDVNGQLVSILDFPAILRAFQAALR